MKKWLSNISRRTWVRTILVTLLFIIVASGFAGEKIAVNDGLGWDGGNYLQSMQHFTEWISNRGYDQYAIRRVMPWGLTNIICKWLDIDITINVAIISGIIYNVIALILSVMFFFRISNLKQWKLTTEALGFIFLFYTYPVLKMIGYYPVLSDMFGLTMGIMLCYYFFADKKWALVTLGFLGSFIWPTSPICAFALAFFPRKELPILLSNDNRIEKTLLNLSFIALACLPFVLLMIKVLRYHETPMSVCQGYCPLTEPSASWMIPISCLCSCLYYYYMTSKFKVSVFSTIKENFVGKSVWCSYLAFMVCVVISTLACKLLANAEPGELTAKMTLYVIACTSMTDPFVFIESHFFFYGIGFLLALVLWRDVAKVIMRQGIGFMFVVAIWILFSIRPEARVSIMYWIFPLMALLMALDTKSIRSYWIGIAAIISLVMSLFWFKINVPDMEKYFDWENFEHYIDFPAQRYFMNSGHWQSHTMYYVFMSITMLCVTIIYIGIRKKWFVSSEN